MVFLLSVFAFTATVSLLFFHLLGLVSVLFSFSLFLLFLPTTSIFFRPFFLLSTSLPRSWTLIFPFSMIWGFFTGRIRRRLRTWTRRAIELGFGFFAWFFLLEFWWLPFFLLSVFVGGLIVYLFFIWIIFMLISFFLSWSFSLIDFF